jgi:replication factor C small subunit
VKEEVERIKAGQTGDRIIQIYEQLKYEPKIRWKTGTVPGPRKEVLMHHHGKWHLKYEPTSLDEMVLNVNTRQKLKYVMDSMEDAILYGPPGCGKGTFVNIFVRNSDRDHMWLNAADEGGVDTIRNKVQSFCYSMPIFDGHRHLIYNEAEKLSLDAQIDLHEVMERAVRTQFIFMTNKVDKIDEPIKSRCVEVEYKNPAQEEVLKFMRRVLAAEGVEYKSSRLTTLAGRYYPDIRKTIKEVQAAFSV